MERSVQVVVAAQGWLPLAGLLRRVPRDSRRCLQGHESRRGTLTLLRAKSVLEQLRIYAVG